MKFKVLPRAVRDLANIHTYVAADDERAAADVALRLHKALEFITSRPEIGRPVPDTKIWEWSVPGLPYIIPYRVRGDVVEILRFFHTSRPRPARWIG
jgi:plasmid stabilization system protein ParE